MKTLTIKNVPEDLHARLKELAVAERRSLNGEILTLLEQAARNQMIAGDRKKILYRTRDLRRRVKGPGLSVAEIDRAISKGRP